MQLLLGQTYDEDDELLTMQLHIARFWLMKSRDAGHQCHSQETTPVTLDLSQLV